MRAGISTACFYPEEVETALDKIIGLGCDTAEIFLNSFSEYSELYLNELRKKADDNGLRIVSVHPFLSALEPFLFFSDYPRRFQDGAEEYKKFFHAANVLGADILVFHGDRRDTSLAHSEIFDRFGTLAGVGKSMGVRLAHENVPRCAGNNPSFFHDMKKALPDIGFVFDIKQCIRAGFEINEMIEAMGSNMIHIHASDHSVQSDCLPIGKGIMSLPDLFNQLKKISYDGMLIVELYEHSYNNMEDLSKSYKYLSDFCEK